MYKVADEFLLIENSVTFDAEFNSLSDGIIFRAVIEEKPTVLPRIPSKFDIFHP